MKRTPFLLLVSSLSLAASLSTSACSVYMAAKQPPRKDLAVLNPGTPRALVLAELGQPVASTEKAGETTDVFAFQQGYSTGAKATRAVFHATADVFTLGLWEIVGTPAEAIFDGTEVKLEVAYDAQSNVKHVRAFSGADVVGDIDGVMPTRPAAEPVAAPAAGPVPQAAPAAASAPAVPAAAPAPAPLAAASVTTIPAAAPVTPPTTVATAENASLAPSTRADAARDFRRKLNETR